MNSTIKIVAFGALNQASYDMFEECLAGAVQKHNKNYSLDIAGPYPNAEAIDEPGRPLRGSALKDPALKEELLAAVAKDARAQGNNYDVYCMPCMSMIGFHDGVEENLGTPIIRLADALQDFYRETPKLGVIHMRPAAKRVAEIFGEKAITPSELQAASLLEAEDRAKQTGSSAPVEAVMAEIVQSFKDQGLTHVLFARADAAMAQKGPAGQLDGIEIHSYFDILADYILGQEA